MDNIINKIVFSLNSFTLFFMKGLNKKGICRGYLWYILQGLSVDLTFFDRIYWGIQNKVIESWAPYDLQELRIIKLQSLSIV